MDLISIDREEGTISDEDFNSIEGDDGLYLDRFEDPFLHTPYNQFKHH